jgi:hypothetical protein
LCVFVRHFTGYVAQPDFFAQRQDIVSEQPGKFAHSWEALASNDLSTKFRGLRRVSPNAETGIDHSRISGQTAMRSVSGSSFLSLMSTDSALTHDSPRKLRRGTNYDDYTPLPLEDRPSGEQWRTLLNRSLAIILKKKRCLGAIGPSAVARGYYRRLSGIWRITSTNSNSMDSSNTGYWTNGINSFLRSR